VIRTEPQSTPHDMFAGDHPESEIYQEDTMAEVATIDQTGGHVQASEPPASHSGAVLDMIVRAATNPDVDVEKMERLMSMHDRIVAQKAESAFNNAMSLTQSETGRVAADASNPQTRSRYASYAAIDRALRPTYTKHGFALSFDTGEGAPEGYMRVLCYVSHRAGHTRTYHADMASDGKGAKGGDVMTKTHAVGSAFTYGQRYLLKMIFNVAVGEDDDGNKGGGAGDTISDEQKQTLVDLMRETDANTAKFLQYLRVGSLDELPAKRFNEARQALEAKKGKANA
jgi:hypothetical protein